MTTGSTQDPIDRFTLRIEEMRSMPGVYGPARRLRNLFLDFFLSIMKLLASLAEQRRNRTLPELTPASAPNQPRARPADLRPRGHAMVEQPEMTESVVETPCEMPMIEQPAAIKLRRVCVGICKKKSEPARACAWRVDDGGWPRLRRPGLSLTMAAGFLGVDWKKRVLGDGDMCAHFVTNW